MSFPDAVRDLAQQLGITHIEMPYRYPKLPYDSSNDLFRLDHNRCVLCTRCVRTCDEIEGVHTLDVASRGIKNRIIVDMRQTFGESTTCTLCGACVTNCPTGALFDKAAAFRGPLASCTQVTTTCSECPVGCGLKVYTKENRIVTVWGDPDSPVNRGHLCVKGRYAFEFVSAPDRATALAMLVFFAPAIGRLLGGLCDHGVAGRDPRRRRARRSDTDRENPPVEPDHLHQGVRPHPQPAHPRNKLHALP